MEKKTDFKALSNKAKVEYIWDYYRFPILATIGIGAAAIYMIHHYVTYQEPLLNVLMVNTPAYIDATTDGFEEFFDAYDYESFPDAVSLISNLQFYDNERVNYENVQALSTVIGAGGQDLFFGTGDVFNYYAGSGALTDLSTVLSKDILNQYEDQLIYCDEDGTVDPYPCAVSLSDNEWLTKYGYYDECCFGIFYSSPNPEIAADFAEFLLTY